MKITDIQFEGLPALELRDETLRMVVIPAWGGKIASIYDLRRGREWLHTNRQFTFGLPLYDADYIGEFDIGGFDECFPNIGAGPYPVFPWRGVALPDHGEVWALPWAVEVQSGALGLRVHGVRLPYSLEKHLSLLGGGRLRIEYRLESRVPFEMPFIWSSHPLLEVHPGMRLEVPAALARVDSRNSVFTARTGVEAGDLVPWPQIGELDLSVIPGPEAGYSVKLVARQLSEGRVALTDPHDGARFEFTFDRQLVTHTGLWLNYGGWSGKAGAEPYYNIGFEPCIGAADRLDLALAAGESAVLPAGGTAAWWLELALS